MKAVCDSLRSIRRFTAAPLVLSLSMFAFSAPLFSAQPLYHLTDLSAVGTDALRPSRAYGINNLGEVVGAAGSNVGDGSHAFLYRGGILTDLGHLAGKPTVAYDINDNSQIVGFTQVAVPPGGNLEVAQHPFLYSSGTMIDLGTFNSVEQEQYNSAQNYAYAVNNSGQVVGSSGGSFNQRAFLYDNGVMTNLGTLGGLESLAFDINDRGQVVGQARINPDSGINHAFLYSGGAMIDLGTLGIFPGSSRANAINNDGQIVGSTTSCNGSACDTSQYAFLYENGVMTNLQKLFDPSWLGFNPGVVTSSATDINNRGDVIGNVVGIRSTFGLPTRTFLYQDQIAYPLKQLLDSSGTGWDIDNVYAINDAGWIVGTGSTTAGSGRRAVLLTPVPEPAAIFLLMLCAATRCCFRWRAGQPGRVSAVRVTRGCHCWLARRWRGARALRPYSVVDCSVRRSPGWRGGQKSLLKRHVSYATFDPAKLRLLFEKLNRPSVVGSRPTSIVMRAAAPAHGRPCAKATKHDMTILSPP
jgi:probable HAF family extracellular repeat protein